MLSCNDCVNCKWELHNTNGLSPRCTGVSESDSIKEWEWIVDLVQANSCQFYDEDSWTK